MGLGRLNSEMQRVSEGSSQDRRGDLDRLEEDGRRVMPSALGVNRGQTLALSEVIVRPLEQSPDSNGQARGRGLTGHEQSGLFRMQSPGLKGQEVG
jgi:hypothetical protein